MARWIKTIDIKPILRRDQTNKDPEYVAAIGKEIAAAVRASTTEDEKTFALLDALDCLEDIEPGPDAVDDFNSALAELYDWADHYRVWLGL